MNNILEKLKDIISKEKANQKIYLKDIAAALDMNYDLFRQAKARGTIPYFEIMQFLAKRKISINYFFFDQLPESLIEPTENFILLKYQKNINATAGAGGINHYLDPQELVVDIQLLNYINSSYKYTEVLHAIGDSMEPLIKENSLIFVDRSKQNITSSKSIFVANTPDGLILKEISTSDTIGNKIMLKSINKNYPPIQYDIEYIEIIGRVCGIFTRL